jgi:hypothetical protein
MALNVLNDDIIIFRRDNSNVVVGAQWLRLALWLCRSQPLILIICIYFWVHISTKQPQGLTYIREHFLIDYRNLRLVTIQNECS